MQYTDNYQPIYNTMNNMMQNGHTSSQEFYQQSNFNLQSTNQNVYSNQQNFNMHQSNTWSPMRQTEPLSNIINQTSNLLNHNSREPQSNCANTNAHINNLRYCYPSTQSQMQNNPQSENLCDIQPNTAIINSANSASQNNNNEISEFNLIFLDCKSFQVYVFNIF